MSYKALLPWSLKSQTKLKDASALLLCLPDAMVLGWFVILRAPASLKFATGQPSAPIIGRTVPIHVQPSESVTKWLFFYYYSLSDLPTV